MGFIGQHRRLARLRGRGLAVALALAVHAILFAGLLWRIEPPVKVDTTPVMEVELTRLRPNRLPNRASISGGPRSEATPRRQVVQAPPDVEPRLVVPQIDDPAIGSDSLRQSLRGRVGCDHSGFLGLSAAERQGCQDRLAQGRAADGRANGAHLDLSRGGVLAKGDAEPVLARKPHNGCVPNVAEKETGTVGAVRQDWSAGIKCAWSF